MSRAGPSRIIVIVAAVLTPGPDVSSMLLLGLPKYSPLRAGNLARPRIEPIPRHLALSCVCVAGVAAAPRARVITGITKYAPAISVAYW